jgi:hypothetical protein
MRAVADFLAGPDVLERPADAIHGDILALAHLHAPRRLDSGIRPAQAPSTPGKGRWAALDVLWVLAGLWRGAPRQSGDKLTALDVEHWLWFEAKGLRRYLLTDSRGSFTQLYEYDQGRFRQIARRGALAILRYAFSSRAAARAWRAGHARLSGWAWWQDRFAAARPPPSPPKPSPRRPDVSIPRKI